MDVKDIKIAQLQKELLKQKEEVKKLNKKLATSKKKVVNKQKELRSIKKTNNKTVRRGGNVRKVVEDVK